MLPHCSNYEVTTMYPEKVNLWRCCAVRDGYHRVNLRQTNVKFYFFGSYEESVGRILIK